MGILEKLRPQPRWKHTDPGVRAAAVYDLGPESADVLVGLAREDPDARVRRVAVTRIDDVGVLGDIGQSDPDDAVRIEAIRGLAGVAVESTTIDRAVQAATRLVALGRSKEAGLAARENPIPEARAALVDLLDDPKVLSSVSRHAADGQTRLRALARLRDPEELANVAVKSEHTDVAVSALESVEDPTVIGVIAQRARNKVAVRRARTKLRQIEDATRAAAEPTVVRMDEADRARALELLQHAELLVANPDPDAASAALSQLRLAWAEFLADVAVDGAIIRQFEAATEGVEEAIDERRRERTVERERQMALQREQADRLAIVAEIEALGGPEAPDRIAELRVRWDSLPPMRPEYAASLTRRFQDASRAFEERERRRTLAAAAVGRLETLATELEQLVASDQPIEDVVARWRGQRRDAEVLREYGEANAAAAERLERAVAALEAKEAELQGIRTRQEQDNLRRLQQLCRQVETLAAGGQLTLKAGDRGLREIRTALDARAPLPSKKDRQEIQARLEAARAALAPRVQELRDADEWQRWANLQVQEELSREMEALAGEENLELAARRMRELQGRWKPVALAPHGQGDAMWRRFKTAQDAVYARTAAFLAAQSAERTANLARKQALCERAEALADSTDWLKTATEIQALQGEWKAVGPVARGHEKAIWDRFRTACDRFFTRRQEDLKQRKEVWAANLARKEALCERAEALAESTDWNAAASAIKQLQAEWKTIGPVRKAKSESTWQRFRTACDRFFDRYKNRDQVELQQKAAAREEVIRRLETLVPPDPAAAGPAPDDLYAIVREARSQWQQAPELPRGVQQGLAARYEQLLGQIVAAWPPTFAGTELDVEATRKRMEKLIARVESLGAEQAPVTERLSPTELLARQLRERLAANTMSGGAKAAEAEASRWRIAEQEVRSVQAQWTRLGPVPPDVGRPLADRFQKVCRQFFDRRRRVS